MEPFVHGDLEALSAGGKKSGAAGTNSPAVILQRSWLVRPRRKIISWQKCRVEIWPKPETGTLVFTFSSSFWIQLGTDQVWNRAVLLHKQSFKYQIIPASPTSNILRKCSVMSLKACGGYRKDREIFYGLISKVKEIQVYWSSMKSSDGFSWWTPPYDEFLAED